MSAVIRALPARRAHLAVVPSVPDTAPRAGASQIDRIEHDIAYMQALLEVLVVRVKALRAGGFR